MEDFSGAVVSELLANEERVPQRCSVPPALTWRALSAALLCSRLEQSQELNREPPGSTAWVRPLPPLVSKGTSNTTHLGR